MRVCGLLSTSERAHVTTDLPSQITFSRLVISCYASVWTPVDERAHPCDHRSVKPNDWFTTSHLML
eukprot:11221189-Lingulodinium_polyedra.AAC.2